MIISLRGGLGNQIFQLGAGLLLGQNALMEEIILDDSALGKYKTKRENELLKFFDLTKIESKVEFKNSILSKFRIPKIAPFNFTKYPFVSDKNFQTILLNPNKNLLLLDGYFQEYLTQENFDEEIRLLKKLYIKNEIGQRDGCVIHIRGGDFVKLGWNSVTPKQYYESAIKMMSEKYDINKFYIVTDDKEYSTSILNEFNIDYEFIGGSMEEDFYLISLFQKRILSSSTFALWASALGDNEDSMVIAPEYWTPDRKREIFLPNEIRIAF